MNRLKSNKVNIVMIIVLLFSILWLGADVNKPALTGDWCALLIMEFAAQVLYTNYKQ